MLCALGVWKGSVCLLMLTLLHPPLCPPSTHVCMHKKWVCTKCVEGECVCADAASPTRSPPGHPHTVLQVCEREWVHADTAPPPLSSLSPMCARTRCGMRTGCVEGECVVVMLPHQPQHCPDLDSVVRRWSSHPLFLFIVLLLLYIDTCPTKGLLLW